MKQQFLLIEDVEDLGRSGDIVQVKPGYARNYLLPQKKALMATIHTLKIQTRLKEERAKQAVIDKQHAETFAAQIEGSSIDINVKVDPEGHMYGSVAAADIAQLLQEKGIQLDRRSVQLPRPLRELGAHRVDLRLKEGVVTYVTVHIKSDNVKEETL